ncbi:hypothetical protein [Glycomyces buryatensis]|uniref:Uncharacterized protein n=1 Tax=Glycomyces buryatensis TaxID=2570927 RepID=A0A4S8QK33_9ACTN|nr:hypothetical protein [Glycomyces buryatensis]THV41104.1 hypothetical protein FAB82_13460 [Glycomyces buryatensis]
MAKTAFDLPPGGEHRMGSFKRGPAAFTIFKISGHPAPNRYRVDCDDGNGPNEVCTFSNKPGESTRWRGAWNNDEWCQWIEEQACKLIAESENN